MLHFYLVRGETMKLEKIRKLQVSVCFSGSPFSHVLHPAATVCWWLPLVFPFTILLFTLISGGCTWERGGCVKQFGMMLEYIGYNESDLKL